MYLRNNKETNVIVVERVTREVMGDQLECLVDRFQDFTFSLSKIGAVESSEQRSEKI